MGLVGEFCLVLEYFIMSWDLCLCSVIYWCFIRRCYLDYLINLL